MNADDITSGILNNNGFIQTNAKQWLYKTNFRQYQESSLSTNYQSPDSI